LRYIALRTRCLVPGNNRWPAPQIIGDTDVKHNVTIRIRENVNEVILCSHGLSGWASGSLDFARDDGAIPLTAHLSPAHSRHRQPREDPFYNRLARNRLRFRFVANDNAVTQNVGTDALDVLGRNVAASI
jgi:hypothetical protein